MASNTELLKVHVHQFTVGLVYFRLASYGKIALMSNISNGVRYHDGVSGSRTRNRSWAIDWHHDL